MKFPFFFLGLFFSVFVTTGQVRDVKSKLKEEENSQTRQRPSTTPQRSSASSSRSSNASVNRQQNANDIRAGLQLFDFVFRIVGVGLVEGQRTVLEKRSDNPQMQSLELNLIGGFDPESQSDIIIPSFQLNWGIFSSEFRHSTLVDVAGSLNTFDWQVVKLNIPVSRFQLSGGIGFTNVPEFNLTYGEQTLEAKLRLWEDKIILAGSLRRTGEKFVGQFRRELGAHLDFELKDAGLFHFSPRIGVKKVTYFGDIEELFVTVGLVIRLYREFE